MMVKSTNSSIISISKEEVYDYYIVKEMSCNEIAQIYNCTNTTIRNRLKKYGIPIRTYADPINQNKMIKGRNTPEAKERHRRGLIRAHAENPQLTKNLTEGLKKAIENDPCIKDIMVGALQRGLRNSWDDTAKRQKRINIRNSPKVKEAQKQGMLEYYVNHPEASELFRQRIKDMWIKPEYRELFIQNIKDKWNNEDFRANITNKLTAICNTPEYIAKMSEFTKNLWLQPEYREHLVQVIRKNNQDPVVLQKRSVSLKQAHINNPSWADKVGKISKEYWAKLSKAEKDIKLKMLSDNRALAWANPDKRKEWIARNLVASHKRPTDIEEKVIETCEQFHIPFKYSGNGTYDVGCKKPDFYYDDPNLKILLECNGVHWHTPEEQAERMEYFARFGYYTLVLWTQDILPPTHKELAKRIKDFVNKCKKGYPIQISLPQQEVKS